MTQGLNANKNKHNSKRCLPFLIDNFGANIRYNNKQFCTHLVTHPRHTGFAVSDIPAKVERIVNFHAVGRGYGQKEAWIKRIENKKADTGVTRISRQSR